MTPFFQKFPLINYTINGDTQSIVSIFERIRFKLAFLADSSIYYDYIVKDSDTPEIIAAKYYGSSYYSWVVMLANEITDPYYDWVMSSEKFSKFLEDKYKIVTLSLSSNLNILNLNTQPKTTKIGIYLDQYGKNYVGSGYYYSNTLKTISIVCNDNIILDNISYISSDGIIFYKVTSHYYNTGLEWQYFINKFSHHYEDKLGNYVSTYDSFKTYLSEDFLISAAPNKNQLYLKSLNLMCLNMGVQGKNIPVGSTIVGYDLVNSSVFLSNNIQGDISSSNQITFIGNDFIKSTYEFNSSPTKATPISYFQYENTLNENKRKIKIINKQFLPQIEKESNSLF